MKKQLYLFLVIVLWCMLSFGIHVYLLITFDGRMPKGDSVWAWYTLLPVMAQLSVLFFGILVGYIVGQHRWHIVYVEKRHRKNFWKKLRKGF